MNDVIQINQLVKKYQNFQLGPLTVSMPKGMIIGLIGENGAGKTTFMKSMLGIIHPDSGEIQMKEEHVGVVLDQSFFPELLTANDIHSIMKDIYKTWDQTLFCRAMLPMRQVWTICLRKLNKNGARLTFWFMPLLSLTKMSSKEDIAIQLWQTFLTQCISLAIRLPIFVQERQKLPTRVQVL